MSERFCALPGLTNPLPARGEREPRRRRKLPSPCLRGEGAGRRMRGCQSCMYSEG
ncbi:hypothetical protein SS05631_b58900 (plasmid) [Sinorhizobium sp. CCBAU 05631]|nr:hypothetical protein SS05631_b58900 [Sinorhizobium sp. CCBAU 05631]